LVEIGKKEGLDFLPSPNKQKKFKSKGDGRVLELDSPLLFAQLLNSIYKVGPLTRPNFESSRLISKKLEPDSISTRPYIAFSSLTLYPRTRLLQLHLHQTNMNSPFLLLTLLLCTASHTIPTLSTTDTIAYPSIPGTETTTDCFNNDELVPVRREVYGGGRIFDISHRYTPDMPSWESEDGVGQFLWLPKSMKNGSQANNSEMKLPTHTGTHVDAPGHVIDHYFDAGFDVDTLDLDVLNGSYLKS
jgi:hypothetical protein